MSPVPHPSTIQPVGSMPTRSQAKARLRSQPQSDMFQMPHIQILGVAYPDPRGPDDDGDPRPPLMVQRNWSIDEIHDIVKDFPDPCDTADHWCTAVTNMEAMYQPSARELETVFRKFSKLRWTNLRGDWDVEAIRGTELFATQFQLLLSRVRAAYLTRTD